MEPTYLSIQASRLTHQNHAHEGFGRYLIEKHAFLHSNFLIIFSKHGVFSKSYVLQLLLGHLSILS